MIVANNQAPTAPTRQGDDNPRYYIKMPKGWRRYTPPAGEPIPFAIWHYKAWRLVFRAVSDAEYFAENPGAKVRFTINDFGNGYFTWRTVTRGGGVMEGDVYDLCARLQTFRHGTPFNRLRRSLRRIAVRDYCRIMEDSPDIVSAWRWRSVA